MHLLINTQIIRADIYYCEGGQRIVYNISDPGGLLFFRDHDAHGYCQRVKQIGVGEWRVTVKADYSPLVSRTPWTIVNVPIHPDGGPFEYLRQEQIQLRYLLIEKLILWLAKNIHYDPLDGTSSFSGVLRNRVASCVGMVSVLGQWFRELGIRYRVIHGILVSGSETTKVGGTFHRWLEVSDPQFGWLPIGVPYSAHFVDASHIVVAVRRQISNELRSSSILSHHKVGISVVTRSDRELQTDTIVDSEVALKYRVMSRIRHSSVITGRVTDVSGCPLRSGQIAIRSGIYRARTELNDDGFYALSGILPGRYTVTLRTSYLPPLDVPEVEVKRNQRVELPIQIPYMEENHAF